MVWYDIHWELLDIASSLPLGVFIRIRSGWELEVGGGERRMRLVEQQNPS